MSSTKTHTKTETWREWRGAARRRPLLDVRSSKEFHLGAVPGALSSPLLDDEERHAVGFCYKQVGRLDATQMGIEIFAGKADRYFDQITSLIGNDCEIAVHCWRGGMRSQFTAMWLASLGLKPVVLKGGYKEYRRHVLDTLDEIASRPVLVLDGRTGSGKSELLRLMRGQVPVIDFEAHARHRGSAFGDFAQPEPVPTQQNFENRVAERYFDLNLGPEPKPILVEIENYIGPLVIPQRLREHIAKAPTVLVSRDFDDRVERLAEEYAAGWTEADDARFVARCDLLKKYLSRAELEEIIQATRRRDFRTATSLLLTLRYDKVYDKGIARRAGSVVATFNLTHELENAKAFLKSYCATEIENGGLKA